MARLTIQRIKLDRGGYDSRGRYWGVGDRLYTCPELADLRERVRVMYRESSEVRAVDLKQAREILTARFTRLNMPGKMWMEGDTQ